MMWWGVPLMLGLSIASFWMIPLIMVPTIEGIATRAPAVRITAGSLLFPFLGVFAALAVLITILRAIPYQGRLVQVMENAFNLTVLASAIVLALVVTTSTPLHAQAGLLPLRTAPGESHRLVHGLGQGPEPLREGKDHRLGQRAAPIHSRETLTGRRPVKEGRYGLSSKPRRSKSS